MQPMSNCVEDWKALPWKKFQKDVFRLQHRIYKAQQNGNYKLVQRLQRLLFTSRAGKFLAIRQVSQLNVGKRTPGIDGISKLNERKRLQLFENLKTLTNYKHSKLRRIWIPKSASTHEKRPLGIPTIKDRAIQCLVKFLLEPVYEAYASKGSWGLRPGRSTWDVQKNIFVNLRAKSNGYQKSILELDIEKCFDNINHEKLLSLLNLPIQIKRIIRSALKAGVLNERTKTLEETPQGGVISLLLCNIALHGIEDLHNEYKQNVMGKPLYNQKGLRYADDIIFFIKPGENTKELRNKIDVFLEQRGLNVNTHLIKSIDGFDFLGWRFEVKPNKSLTCFPTKENRKKMIAKIKTTMRDTGMTLEKRYSKIKTIHRRWRNYHQFCDLSKVNLWAISNWTYRFAKKLNSKLSKIKRAEEKQNRINKIQGIFNNHKYKLFQFVAVKAEKSPFDNDWLYWSKRKHNLYWGLTSKVLKVQKFKCAHCNLNFATDDIIELHHIDGNHKNN
jgi:group II intron reverse transcriptase/maturase